MTEEMRQETKKIEEMIMNNTLNDKGVELIEDQFSIYSYLKQLLEMKKESKI